MEKVITFGALYTMSTYFTSYIRFHMGHSSRSCGSVCTTAGIFTGGWPSAIL